MLFYFYKESALLEYFSSYNSTKFQVRELIISQVYILEIWEIFLATISRIPI